MYEEGHYLALLSPEGSFYICQARQDIPYKSTRKYKIQWLEEVSTNTYVKLDSQDTISTNTIIDEVLLSKISKNKYILTEIEKQRIINLLQLCKGEVKGKKCSNAPRNLTEGHDTPPNVIESDNFSVSVQDGNDNPTNVQESINIHINVTENNDDDDDAFTFIHNNLDKEQQRKQKFKRLRIISSSSFSSDSNEQEQVNAKRDKKKKKSPLKIKDNLEVKVGRKESTSDSKRKYDERHCCYFCHKIVNKMSKHLQIVHKDEIDVAKIMAMPKNSQQRRDAFTALRRVGDYYHNTEVLATKTGELILIRRPSENEGHFVSFTDFGPCPHCLGFLLKKHIWHHIKHSCHIKKVNIDRKMALAESNALLHIGNSSVPADFTTNIIQKLKGNEIPYICKNDELILRFGLFQWEKYKVTNYELVRQTMRQLARLLIEFRKTSKLKKASLSDCLLPEHFDLLVESVRNLCKETSNETERPTLENAPSLALKLGHNLRKCANLERGRALRAGDVTKDTALQGFLHLMSWEWSQKISSTALSTLNRRRFNTEELLPLTSDLMKLSSYMKNRISSLSVKIKKEFNEETWHRLKDVTLARVMIFNKRRSGEAAKMRLKEYYSNVDWMGGNTQELTKTFTPVEMHLSKTLKLVNVIGKRERKVPVIITPDCQQAISILKEFRDQVQSVSKENMYLFPSKHTKKHLRGDKVLRIMCNNAKLEKPDLVTSTRLRKYMATVIQIFDLSENESDWIARHLGHDIRIHRDYYRLQESAVELTKVSRLLMVVDEGRAAEFKNKPLDEIALEDIPPVYEDGSEREEDQPQSDFHNEDISLQSPQGSKPTTNSDKGTKVKGVKKRPRLDIEVKMQILKAFRKNIKRGIVPNKDECCEFLQTHQHINKTWRNVKDCVHNHMVSMSKSRKKNLN